MKLVIEIPDKPHWQYRDRMQTYWSHFRNDYAAYLDTPEDSAEEDAAREQAMEHAWFFMEQLYDCEFLEGLEK